ncbi:MAG: LysM peptidoglycan-binding domain-containing protein [Planctomycetota bacterium]
MKPVTAIAIIIVIFLIGLGIVFWQLGLFDSGQPMESEPIFEPITSTFSTPITPTDLTSTAISPITDSIGTESFYPYSSMTPTMTAETSYTVKTGDTLWIVAQNFYNDGSKWKIIHEANRAKISNPNNLKVGTTLVIPQAEKSIGNRQATGISNQQTPETYTTYEKKSGTYYTVRKGDSLWRLARKFYNDSSKKNLIFEANRDKLATPETTLKPGWKLFIPTAPKKESKSSKSTKKTTPTPPAVQPIPPPSSDNVPTGVGD